MATSGRGESVAVRSKHGDIPLRGFVDTTKSGITAVTGAYTLTDEDDFISASGTFTIKTPATETTGKTYAIKNIGSGTITVDADNLGSTTIDEETTQELTQYDNMKFTFDGTEYWIR